MGVQFARLAPSQRKQKVKFCSQSFCPLCRPICITSPPENPVLSTEQGALPSPLSSPGACLLLLYLGPAEHFLTGAVKLVRIRSSLVFAVNFESGYSKG